MQSPAHGVGINDHDLFISRCVTNTGAATNVPVSTLNRWAQHHTSIGDMR
jgi:hypothetical protein